ncbi:MAG: potassium/proton antiporter [Acidimicrobiales bacterium]
MHISLPSDDLLLGGALLLIASVLGAGLADRVRVPSLLLFLGIGMAIGDDGLDLISLSDPELTQGLAIAALVVILYEGGLSIRLPDARRVAAPALSLATLGVLVTGGVVALVAAPLLDVDRTTALLIGAVVASTDAAAVFASLRRVAVPRRLGHLLEVESGANDPMAVMLTVGLLAAWEGRPDAADWVVFGVRNLAGGVLIGLVVGWVGGIVLARVRLASASLYPVLAVGLAGLAYGLGAAGRSSGFLAVYVCGIVVADRAPARRRAVVGYLQALAATAQIGLFLLLGLLVFPSRLDEHALGALGVALGLVLVARPLAVVLGIAWLGFGRRELVMVSWAGLRGAVPIVLATFPLTEGYPQGELIFDVVFFVVILSVLVQGFTLAPLVARLGLAADPPSLATVAEALPLDAPGVEALEIEVGSSAALVGRRLRDVPPPHEARVAVVLRGGEVVVATGATTVAAGDRLVLFAPGRGELRADLEAWVVDPMAARIGSSDR